MLINKHINSADIKFLANNFLLLFSIMNIIFKRQGCIIDEDNGQNSKTLCRYEDKHAHIVLPENIYNMFYPKIQIQIHISKF